MLGDRFFYPLAALVIVAMVGLALSFGGGESLDEARILEDGYTLSGMDLEALTISPGSEGVYVDEDGGYIQLLQFTPDGVGPSSIGVFATLPADYERAFAGRQLRVTMRARASRTQPLGAFDAAYYTLDGGGSSPWRTFELTSDWQDHSYIYTPPIVDAPENVDLVAVFPGKEGERERMDLAELRIEVVGEAGG
ncbi:MAG: hypothetical protein WBF53_11670 [Litorimonas sp.]